MISEIEVAVIETETEREHLAIYMELTVQIAASFIKPYSKGRADGSIRRSLTKDEIGAYLFFSFGILCQKLMSIQRNQDLSEMVDTYGTMHSSLQMMRQFLSTEDSAIGGKMNESE